MAVNAAWWTANLQVVGSNLAGVDHEMRPNQKPYLGLLLSLFFAALVRP